LSQGLHSSTADACGGRDCCTDGKAARDVILVGERDASVEKFPTGVLGTGSQNVVDEEVATHSR